MAVQTGTIPKRAAAVTNQTIWHRTAAGSDNMNIPREQAIISDLEVYTVQVSPKTTWIFVRTCATDGSEGWGEATRFELVAAIAAELALLRAALLGRGTREAHSVLMAARTTLSSKVRGFAIHAVEQSLMDLQARRAGLPLVDMLGGPFRQSVPFYANLNRGVADRTPRGFAERAREVAAAGYTAIKLAPFDGLEWSSASPESWRRLLAAGIDRILAVREAVGPAPLLLVDCHWRLTLLMVFDVLRETESAQLYWLEDPLEDAQFSGADARRVRSAANARGVRLAGGERLTSVAGMRDLLQRGAYDVVLPDLRDTGVRGGIAMLELAVASGVEASLHNPVGPVLDALSVHVAAALPSFSILEGQVFESPLFDEIAGGPRRLNAGCRLVAETPGIGLIPKLAPSAQP